MTRLKHVLVLIILILPMFALAPALVASPNETLVSQEKVDTSLPAQLFVETLRVAVYAESNLTLPAYATGGVATNHYQNVIDLLESAGYAVTALSTQDILDHKLMVADYDAFVLPNQLPKDEIVNLVKDYWLGGGGILNFANSVGFCFYAGIIDPSYEGSDQLGPEWMWGSGFPNISIVDRHPVTKAYDIGDRFIEPGSLTYFSPDVATTTSDRFIPLAVNDLDPTAWNIFALDNPNRGGKFVHLPGNCSVISSWLEPIIIDAVDWLAPRPKGRILVDLTHDPLITVDSWDEGSSAEYGVWRDTMVNHTFIVDKLHPSSAGNLTAANLNSYDMLFIPMPRVNFTSSEVAAVTSWVSAGGGLFCLGDRWIGSLAEYDQNLNYLLMNFDISIFETGDVGDPIDFYDIHSTTEGCTTFYNNIYGLVNFTGDASGVWRTDDVNYLSAADTYGSGRIILFADINWMAEIYIGDNSHYQYAINVANWLTAATADVLLHVDNFGIDSPWDAPAIDALNDLGIDFYLTFTESYMNLSLYSQQWNLVILDSAWPGIGPYLDDVSSYIDAGGDLIVSWHQVDVFDTEPFYAKVGFGFAGDLPDKAPFYIWETDHGVFNYPNDYGALNFTSVDDYGDEGDLLTVYSNATALGGLTDTNLPGNATTVLGFNEQVIWNSYLIDQLTGDYDDSTYSDSFELWQNEIAFLYYDRPAIDHPSDVTYMETETGNEITWTPTADAGPWEYVFSVNGTPDQGGPWNGAPLTFSVDGVNISITEYELTVFDRLGYSVSDMVTLNVTEYIEPGPGPLDIDPMLLLIIGAAVVGVVVILVIFMKRGKKE